MGFGWMEWLGEGILQRNSPRKIADVFLKGNRFDGNSKDIRYHDPERDSMG